MNGEENITTSEKTKEIRYPDNLRDYFAGQAVAGLLADPKVLLKTQEHYSVAATICYNMADAMIKAREK